MTAGPFGAASFDAAGNTLTDQGGGRVFSYTQSGQLASATVGGVSTTYVYNAFGLRAAKIGATTTYFVYDLLGNLITETDASGNFLAEYFRDDESRPFAAYRPSQIAYLHTDNRLMPSTALSVLADLAQFSPQETAALRILLDASPVAIRSDETLIPTADILTALASNGGAVRDVQGAFNDRIAPLVTHARRVDLGNGSTVQFAPLETYLWNRGTPFVRYKLNRAFCHCLLEIAKQRDIAPF